MLSGLLERLLRLFALSPPRVSQEHERDVLSSLEQTETLIAEAVARGNLEFIPLLADVRALRGKAIDESFRKAVMALDGMFPYVMNPYIGPTWSESPNPKLLKRLRREGVRFADSPLPSAHAIEERLTQLRACTTRAFRVPTREMLAAAAAADPTQRTVDLGRHRLYFLKLEHGGGLVIDDGWYVPAGRALHAVISPDGHYLIVEGEPLAETPGGLYLVDAQRYRWARLGPTEGQTVHLEQLELDAEGVWIPHVDPSGALGRVYRRYAAVRFETCARR